MFDRDPDEDDFEDELDGEEMELDEDDLEDEEDLEKLDDHLDDEEASDDDEELQDEDALEDDPWEKQVRMNKSKGSRKDNLW